MLFKFVFDIFLTFCMSVFFILFWGFFKVNSKGFLHNRAATLVIPVQVCQIGRFVVKFPKFGHISSWLAVRFLGWPFGFFWPFFKVVWPKIFSVKPFWKICSILKLNYQQQEQHL